jgi:hypothetical protein
MKISRRWLAALAERLRCSPSAPRPPTTRCGSTAALAAARSATTPTSATGGPATTAAGVNKKSVNWDGYNNIATTNQHIRNALDCYCTGPNWCYVAAHSAGNLQIGYALALYGTSTRSIKTPSPNAAGQCGNSGAGTQTGWNIKWVNVAGGAAGGSELANAGDWALSEPLVADLKTSTARALYNHNSTTGKWFYLFAGSKGHAVFLRAARAGRRGHRLPLQRRRLGQQRRQLLQPG